MLPSGATGSGSGEEVAPMHGGSICYPYAVLPHNMTEDNRVTDLKLTFAHKHQMGGEEGGSYALFSAHYLLLLKDVHVRMGSKGYESIHISFSTNHVDFYKFFSTTEARRSLWTLRPMSVVSTDNKVVSTVLA
eukprot:scaffold14033_cov54-Attheya_sp.AAC.2